MADLLRQKQRAYAELGITLHIQEDPLIIVVLTPVIKRAHEQDLAGEVVFVDSSGSCDQGGSVVTFLFGASKAGELPLACVLHQEQSEPNYTAAFRAVREAARPSAFGGKGESATFMTDDSIAERRGLKSAFSAAVLLLCIFHMCQALWRWLWESSHGILKNYKKSLINLARSVLYAKNKDSCDNSWAALMGSSVSLMYDKFREHMQGRWDRQAFTPA